MFGRHIARVGDALRILSRVLLTRFDHDRSNLGNTHTPVRPPARFANGEKPNLTQSLDYSPP